MERKSLKRNKISYYLLSFNSGLISLSELAINYYMKDVLQIEPSILSKIIPLTKELELAVTITLE